MTRLWAFSLTALKHFRREMSIKWRKCSIWDKFRSFPLSIQNRKLMNPCPISWMEHTFQLQKFPNSKGDYHIPHNFPVKSPQNMCSIYIQTGIFRNLVVNGHRLISNYNTLTKCWGVTIQWQLFCTTFA